MKALLLTLAAICVPADVVSVTDGDTFKAEARPWPRMIVEVAVRVDGVDTPEKGWRAKCDAERRLGAKASKFAKARIKPGDRVLLCSVEEGKYAKRALARVILADGTDYGQALIDAGLAVLYDGGTKRSWCGGD